MRRVDELRIALPRLTLAAKSWGDPALPPLLALHGWLDNAGSFDRLAPLLCERRHVIALDLPGHGRSQHRPPGARYHYVDYLDDLVDVYAHFGWTRIDLLGHSLGGAIASVFAAAYPERVRELVLIESLGPLTTAPEDTLKQLRNGLDERVGGEGAPRVYPDIGSAAQARQRANGLSEAAAHALVERGLRAVDGGFVWSSDARLRLPSLQRYSETQILAMLKELKTPTLLLLAEPENPLVHSEAMQARKAAVADLEIVRIAGNHHLHLEDPESAAAAILSFWERRAAAG